MDLIRTRLGDDEQTPNRRREPMINNLLALPPPVLRERSGKLVVPANPSRTGRGFMCAGARVDVDNL